ncbi:MAG: eCIS core domain-containing protein [Thermomicrobiales bacterium]
MDRMMGQRRRVDTPALSLSSLDLAAALAAESRPATGAVQRDWQIQDRQRGGASDVPSPQPLHRDFGEIAVWDAGHADHDRPPLAAPVAQRENAQHTNEGNTLETGGAVVGPEGGALDPALADRITSKSNSGASLDQETRGAMEGAFGTSFAEVHVHADSEAHDFNRSLSARAFTTGSDIFFQDGAYQPNSPDGQQLLAHELTHVVQQRAMSVNEPLTVGATDSGYEREADATSAAVANAIDSDHGLAGMTTPGGGPGVARMIQRAPTGLIQRDEPKPGDAKEGDKKEGDHKEGPKGAIAIGTKFATGYEHEFEATPPVQLGPVQFTGLKLAIATLDATVSAVPGGHGEAENKATGGVEYDVAKGVALKVETEQEFHKRMEGTWMEFTPKLKEGGKLSKEGGEVGIEVDAETEHGLTGLKFTILEGKFEEGHVHFATLSLVRELKYKPSPIELKNGTKVELEAAKVTAELKFNPNSAMIRKYVLESAEAIGVEGLIAGGLILGGAVAIIWFFAELGRGEEIAARGDEAAKKANALKGSFVNVMKGDPPDGSPEGAEGAKAAEQQLNTAPIPRPLASEYWQKHQIELWNKADKEVGAPAYDAAVEAYKKEHWFEMMIGETQNLHVLQRVLSAALNYNP